MKKQERAVVAGIGMTRFAEHLDRGIRSLAEEAVGETLKDAGMAPKDVEAAFFSNAAAGLLTGQEMIRGQVALGNTRILGVPLFKHRERVRVSVICVSSRLDVSRIGHVPRGPRGGRREDDSRGQEPPVPRHRSSRRSRRVARDSGARGQLRTGRAERGAPAKSLFMGIYAAATREYMKASGATAATFADVAAKSHAFAALNPRAQYREAVTREQVLASGIISPPLTLPMCSRIGDGAAAVVMSEKAARKARVSKPVSLRASIVMSGRDRAEGEPSVLERVVKLAYETSGVGPSELDVIELHDAAAPAELIAYEELGLCGRREGSVLFASGQTQLGGRHVVNPSGGVLSKRHPVGATGNRADLRDCRAASWPGRNAPGTERPCWAD